MTWRGISLDATGIILDARIGWATALPVLALLALLAAAILAYRRSVRGHGWLARLTAWVNARQQRHNFEPSPAPVVLLAIAVSLVWGALLLIALFGMVWVPVTLALGEPLSEAGELRWYLLTFTALTAALGALVALPFTALRTYQNHRQTRTAEQSHITDQITKAVEALGAEKTVSRIGRIITVKAADGRDTRIEWKGEPLVYEGDEEIEKIGDWQALEETVPNREVRIGGIYALERIAQDSLRDHVQIMEILTAYIRENAKAEGLAPLVPALAPLPDDATPEARAAHVKAITERAERIGVAARDLTADTVIQAALQVIARRDGSHRGQEASDARYGKGGYRLDLRYANLRGVFARGGHFSNANLESARMERANLVQARLHRARLSHVHLEGAWLSEANLDDAELVGAHLERAVLVRAQLRRADLGGANLVRAALGDAQLQSASLIEAQLQQAWLDSANLEGARLERAHLHSAILNGANLMGALLLGTRLDRALGLVSASLRGAGLKEIDLSSLSLDVDEGPTEFSRLLSEAYGDGSVRLPDGVPRPEHWERGSLGSSDFRGEWRAFQRSIGYTPP